MSSNYNLYVCKDYLFFLWQWSFAYKATICFAKISDIRFNLKCTCCKFLLNCELFGVVRHQRDISRNKTLHIHDLWIARYRTRFYAMFHVYNIREALEWTCLLCLKWGVSRVLEKFNFFIWDFSLCVISEFRCF